MNPEAQRITLAKWAGWRDIHWYEDNAGPGFWSGVPKYTEEQILAMPKHEYMEINCPKPIPDYLNDLNAVHLLEQKLGELQKRPYVEWLVSLMKPGEYTVMAPADKRCEAMLKMLGLWMEEA